MVGKEAKTVWKGDLHQLSQLPGLVDLVGAVWNVAAKVILSLEREGGTRQMRNRQMRK